MGVILARTYGRIAFLQRHRGASLVDLDIDDRAANADRGGRGVDLIGGLRRIPSNETERSLRQIENRLGISGLAAAGEAGVSRALAILRADLERTMKLLGCISLADLDASYLDASPGWQR